MRILKSYIGLTIILLSLSCDNEKNEPPGSTPPDNPTSPALNTTCGTDIVELINRNDGEDTVPSWEEIDCFSSKLNRIPQPNFLAGVLANLARYSEDRTTRNLGWVMYSDIDSQHASAVTNRSIWNNLNAVPPYLDLASNTAYTFPLKPEWHEKKIRVAAAMLVAQKLKKRYVTATFFYPPTMSWTSIAPTLNSFKKWYTDHFIPEKIVEAKALERIKAESYSPFPVELETWVEMLPFSSSSTISEKVQLAQWMVDSLVPQLRENFKGSISVYSYVNYELKGSAWNQMNYSKFDFIGFSYFPICGGTDHKLYLESQFSNYFKVLEASGSTKWGLTEIGPNETTWVKNGCMTMEAYKIAEFEIYSNLISKLKEVTPQPMASGFSLTFTNPATKEAVESFVNSKIN